ncbi:XkdX family protein [Halobacillus sp. SY10]
MYFETIKQYYEWNLYDNKDVADFVEYDWLTPAQYQEITGEEYVA